MSTSPWTRLRKRMGGYEAKANEMPDEHGYRACKNLDGLQALRRAVEIEIDREILRAREQGATWASIGFGGSRQAAQQRHAKAVERQGPLTRSITRTEFHERKEAQR